MAYEIPETEPSSLVVGDTWKWKKDLSDFPAPTWTLKYNFVSSDSNAANISITASADGTTHSISVAKATTAGYKHGDYKWYSYVDDGTSRYNVASGSISILPDPSTVTDSRSHVKKTLDAIEATIEGVATNDQKAYTIAGRSLQRYGLDELLMLKDRYQGLYQQEINKENAENGKGSNRTVKVRFTNHG
jgi:hypothetical protein